jgi:hypothetical protein
MVTVITVLEGSSYAILGFYLPIMPSLWCASYAFVLSGLAIYTCVCSTFETKFATRLPSVISILVAGAFFVHTGEYLFKGIIMYLLGAFLATLRILVNDLSDFINGHQKFRCSPNDYSAGVLLLSTRQVSLEPFERYYRLNRMRRDTTNIPPEGVVTETKTDFVREVAEARLRAFGAQTEQREMPGLHPPV